MIAGIRQLNTWIFAKNVTQKTFIKRWSKMAKVTIQITDKSNGDIAVTFEPPIKEILAAYKNAPDKLTAAHCYAAAAAEAIRQLSKEMKSMDSGLSFEDKKRIIIPNMKF